MRVAFVAYEAAVRRQLELLSAGRRDAARRLDSTRVAPGFDALLGSVRGAAATSDRASRRSERRARLWATVAILLSALVLAALFALLERARRHRASAAAAAEGRREREEHFAALLSNSSDVVLVVGPDGRVQSVTEPIARMAGWTPEELRGRPLDAILLTGDEDTTAPSWLALLAGAGAEGLDAQPPRRQRQPRAGRGAGQRPPRPAGVGGVILNIRDISERQALEGRLRHHAFHDALTGLPNRVLFEDRIAHALAAARARGRGLAVLFLDLDDFKIVNDSLGHAAGDGCSRRSPSGCARRVRAGDTVARARRRRVRDPDRGRRRRRRPSARRRPHLRGAARADPDRRQGASSSTRASGSRSTRRGADAATHRASCCATPTSRCTRPRRAGKDRYELFEPRMHEAALAAARARGRARRAIERGEFELALPADRAARRPAASAASRRWCAGCHPDARPRPAGGVHPARRGDRPHRADRRAGCCARPAEQLAAWRATLGDRRAGLRQRQRRRPPARAARARRRGRAPRWPSSRPRRRTRCMLEMTESTLIDDSGRDAARAAASCARSACGSRSTTSGPATRR